MNYVARSVTGKPNAWRSSVNGAAGNKSGPFWIAGWPMPRSKAVQRFSLRSTAPWDGQAFAPLYVHGNAAVFQSPGAAPFSLDMGPLLISVLGKAAIKKTLSALVDELPDGLEPVAKAKRLAAIEAELLRLETEEEEIIVELEQAGETILRRADARPEIILA
jgi:hypothetical protein